MTRATTNRWWLGFALAGLMAAISGSVACAHFIADTSEGQSPAVTADISFPDDASFTSDTLDPPLAALIVKSTAQVGMGRSQGSSQPLHSSDQSGIPGNSCVVILSLTSADQNLRLRI